MGSRSENWIKSIKQGNVTFHLRNSLLYPALHFYLLGGGDYILSSFLFLLLLPLNFTPVDPMPLMRSPGGFAKVITISWLLLGKCSARRHNIPLGINEATSAAVGGADIPFTHPFLRALVTGCTLDPQWEIIL